jgi:hypothetical protein
MATNPTVTIKQPTWPTIVLFSLGFWLSACLLLDLVILPSMYAGGMMKAAGFASVGYLLFGMFNRIELLCAALVLTGILTVVKRHQLNPKWTIPAIILSVILLFVALIDTYSLTPQMSALAMQLNVFEPVQGIPSGMTQMQQGYWMLELFKLGSSGILLSWMYRNQQQRLAS